MEVRLLAVTSFVRDRGRAFVVATAVAMSAAFLSAPAAFGAVDGDPIAYSTYTFDLSKGFKKKLQANGVKMNGSVRVTKGDIDPTTGAGDLNFASLAFSKGGKKINFRHLKGSMPGKVSGSKGKLFQLSAPASLSRAGFGANLGAVSVKLLGSAAKKINKTLGLHSLKAGSVGSFTLDYQPRTVKILGGTATVTGALTAGSVVLKLLTAHCGTIPAPVAPATQTLPETFFPVGGGTISPLGTEGVVQQQGGVRIINSTAGACATSPTASLVQEGFAVNLALQNIQAHVVVEQAAALCGGSGSVCPPFTGDKGVAITQLADPEGALVILDVTNHTISVNGATIKINDVSATTLNGVFPNVTGNPANDFKGGDVFGASDLTVTTR
jgi:hypothetical protein